MSPGLVDCKAEVLITTSRRFVRDLLGSVRFDLLVDEHFVRAEVVVLRIF
jgi:hypothetical protein